jgi:DNA-binding transcriptional LysR family regulator
MSGIRMSRLSPSASGIRLTAVGRAVMLHVRRALAELGAIEPAGIKNGT